MKYLTLANVSLLKPYCSSSVPYAPDSRNQSIRALACIFSTTNSKLKSQLFHAIMWAYFPLVKWYVLYIHEKIIYKISHNTTSWQHFIFVSYVVNNSKKFIFDHIIGNGSTWPGHDALWRFFLNRSTKIRNTELIIMVMLDFEEHIWNCFKVLGSLVWTDFRI